MILIERSTLTLTVTLTLNETVFFFRQRLRWRRGRLVADDVDFSSAVIAADAVVVVDAVRRRTSGFRRLRRALGYDLEETGARTNTWYSMISSHLPKVLTNVILFSSPDIVGRIVRLLTLVLNSEWTRISASHLLPTSTLENISPLTSCRTLE